VDGVGLLALSGVRTVTDQAQALRLVVLVDRLYDRDVPVIASGVPLDRLFSAEMLRGGYRKKYFRAVSRLVALARDGQSMVG
jgi:cell division protein ZapE